MKIKGICKSKFQIPKKHAKHGPTSNRDDLPITVTLIKKKVQSPENKKGFGRHYRVDLENRV